MENEGDSLTLGSLFDGIGGWQLAAVECGIKPLWSSEIDDFPMAVSKYHFPDTVQLGDITKINGAEIDPVDIICAGSPCQDLSMAGKREGLKGERSGLFMDSVRIVREMRAATNGEYPKWFVWENVPGAYSSNKGNDFRAVLEEITETEVPMPDSGRWAQGGLVRSPKCDVAWRTLDAQYWGVPQRRKRIFLVADFRAERRPEVLFESESMPWYPAESKEQGQGITGDIGKDAETAEYSVACIGNGQVAQLYLQPKVGALNRMNEQQYVMYSLDRASFNQGKNAKYDFKIEKNKCSTLVARGPGAVAVPIKEE